MRIFLALPAYNEEQGLPKLLDAFHKELRGRSLQGRVVIVDDGSKDRTCEIIRQWSSKLTIDLVIHPENRGLGETIRDALRKAAELARQGDVIISMDADNTHSVALIPKMLRSIRSGTDLVIASRYRKGSKVVGLSPFRHVMSYGARILFQLVFPITGVRDYTCGFRAYRAEILQQAFTLEGNQFVTERSFACMAEILLKLSKMNLKMAEVAMVLRYDQKQGASKMRVGPTVFKTIRLIVRTRFARVRHLSTPTGLAEASSARDVKALRASATSGRSSGR